jgi:AcrR family transcriptional regulator
MARPASDIKARILSAATDQFARVGVDAASMRTIAKDAGTSVAMVSYHFEHKDGLFRATIDDVYDRFLSELTSIAVEHPDPMKRLQALLGRMSHVRTEEMGMLRTILREASVESVRVQYVVMRFMSGHGRLLYGALDEAMTQGLIRKAPLPMVIPLIVAPIVFPQMLSGTVGEAMPEIGWLGPQMAFDLIFNGLRLRDDVPIEIGEWSDARRLMLGGTEG